MTFHEWWEKEGKIPWTAKGSARLAWSASREETIEECAKIADGYAKDKFPESQWTATHIAERIRSLGKREAKPTK